MPKTWLYLQTVVVGVITGPISVCHFAKKKKKINMGNHGPGWTLPVSLTMYMDELGLERLAIVLVVQFLPFYLHYLGYLYMPEALARDPVL